MLGIGGLAAHGRLSIVISLAIACAAALPIDLLWHRFGVLRGIGALRFMCRWSLDADSCVQRTETLFAQYGGRGLLIAKFVPGLTAIAPALAGLAKVPLVRFLAFDAAGTVFWAGSWMSLGYLFSPALKLIVVEVSRAGSLLGALAAGFILYVLVKMVLRRRFLRRVRTGRITASNLKMMLDRGDDVWIADLRSTMDVIASPYTIPGARWIAAEAIARAPAELPYDRELVLVCS